MFLLSLWYGILFLIPSEFQTYLRKENNTMNKVKYLPLIILCMLLTGCGNKNNISEEVSTENSRTYFRSRIKNGSGNRVRKHFWI